MTDSKVNMSLDDIIKLNKKNKPAFPKKGGQQQRGGARAAGRGARGAAATGRAGNKGGSPRKGGLARAKGAAVNKAGVRKGAAVNQQTKKLVSQLVKKALKNRLGGSLAARRAAVATTGVTRVGRAGLRLGRVAARSRVIGRNRISAPITVPTVVRRQRGARQGRPVFQNQIVRPVIVQRQQRARPVVVERVIQAPRQRVVQRVVQRARQQRVIVQQQPIRQRVIQRPQQRVIVVERQAPQRVQKVIHVQQRQRPQFVRQQQQRIEYVEQRPAQQQSFRKNNAFRNALGGGVNRRIVQTVQRFEPPTFGGAQVRRGRGFQNF